MKMAIAAAQSDCMGRNPNRSEAKVLSTDPPDSSCSAADWPPDRIEAAPAQKNCVPLVTIIDGPPTIATRTPLTTPISAPPARAARTPSHGCPSVVSHQAKRKPENAITEGK